MVPQSTPEELKEAEKGAYEAFKLWKEVPIQQRQVWLEKFQVEKRNDESHNILRT